MIVVDERLTQPTKQTCAHCGAPATHTIEEPLSERDYITFDSGNDVTRIATRQPRTALFCADCAVLAQKAERWT